MANTYAYIEKTPESIEIDKKIDEYASSKDRTSTKDKEFHRNCRQNWTVIYQ
jgi:hypothetical protein